MLAMPSILPLAIKYATNLGRIHLAEKLGELEPQFKQQEIERKKLDEDEAANNIIMSTPTSIHNLITANQESSSTTPVPVRIIQFYII